MQGPEAVATRSIGKAKSRMSRNPPLKVSRDGDSQYSMHSIPDGISEAIQNISETRSNSLNLLRGRSRLGFFVQSEFLVR
jgi:hypothetical protein